MKKGSGYYGSDTASQEKFDQRCRTQYALLNQSRWWVDKEHKATLVADMVPVWRERAASALLRQCRTYLLHYNHAEKLLLNGGPWVQAPMLLTEDGESRYGEGFHVDIDVAEHFARLSEMDLEYERYWRSRNPQWWMRKTPLWRVLKGMDKPPEEET
jgi:hypothetical protein